MKKLKIACVILFASALIVWLILSAIYQNCFWMICFKDWIALVVTLIIGIVFAYIFTEKNNKHQRFLSIYTQIMDSTDFALNQCDDWILNSYLKDNYESQLLTYNKLLNNSINNLIKYSKRMGLVEELAFIKEQLAEYKGITTESIDYLKNEEKQRIKASLKINLIRQKIEESKLKLYE